MPLFVSSKFKFGLVCLFVLAGTCVGIGQNYSLQNSWQVNPYVVNPANAISDYTQVGFAYRTQWLGMPGAPKFASLVGNTLLDKSRTGVGLKVSNFTRGFLTTNDFSASFAYGVPINKTNKLLFGLGGGLMTQAINWNLVSDDDVDDPLLGTIGNSVVPAVSFGVLVKNSSGFNFGISMPQLMRSQTLTSNFQVQPDNLIVMAYFSNWAPQTGIKSHNRSRRHAKSKKDGSPLEIYSLYRYTKSGGQAEVFAKFNTKAAWLSVGYRQGFGVIPSVGFNLGKINLQYTYEPGLGGDIPLKSHEFVLMAKLGDKKMFKGDPGSKPKNTTPPPPKPRLSNNDPSITVKNSKNTNKNNQTATASNKNTQSNGNNPRNRPTDTNLGTATTPVVTQTEEKKPPVETKTEEKKPPVVTQTEEKKPPVETKTEEKKPPVVTQTEEKKPPVETKTEEKKPPVVTQTEEKKPPVVTQTEEKKPPVVTQTEEKKPPVVTQTEEKKQPVETKTEETKPPVVTQTEEKKPPVEAKTEEKKTSPGEIVHLTAEEQATHEEDVLQRLDEHSDNPTEEHEGEEHPHAERHEFWARGDHEKELEIGHYVIVGVFKSEANAKRVSDGYRNLGFAEVDYGFQSGKGFWFVHIAGSEDMDIPDAQKLRNKYRKMKMFRDAWLLTVHQ